MGENIFRFPVAPNCSHCALAVRNFSGLFRRKSSSWPVDQLRFCETRNYERDNQYFSSCDFVLLFPLLLARSENVWAKYLNKKRGGLDHVRETIPFARTLNRIYP